jgi:hypothetical protein
MTSVFCGEIDVTGEVMTDGGIDEMRLTFSGSGSVCRLTGRFSGPSCVEVEELAVAVAADGSLTFVDSEGITSCAPPGCQFNPGDAPCALGDRAGDIALTSGAATGDTLEITTEPPSGLCQSFDLPTRVTYQRM